MMKRNYFIVTGTHRISALLAARWPTGA